MSFRQEEGGWTLPLLDHCAALKHFLVPSLHGGQTTRAQKSSKGLLEDNTQETTVVNI